MIPKGTRAIAILRHCRRCGEWRSIEVFKGLGKVCERCVGGGKANDRLAIPRAIVLTPNGRAILKAGGP